MQVTRSQIRKIIKEAISTPEPVDVVTGAGESPEFYLLGYWSNAYPRTLMDNREYFWGGPFDSRKEAASFGAMKQKRGQPKKFRDWGVGENQIFSSKESFWKTAVKSAMPLPRFSDDV